MTQNLLTNLEQEFLPKILGFAYLKMNSKEDAEDLAQEIVLQILSAIHTGKQIENLNAFVWSVSNRTFFKRLRKKKDIVYQLHSLCSLGEIDDAIIKCEERSLLLREISLLSKKYREAIVLHYFESKNIAEISDVLGKSTGTIKWWLHDARKHIKEGMNTMREYGIRSVKPGALKVGCTGSLGADNEPSSCATRKSSQNILLAAYSNPISVEELSIELGISAPYIEDEVAMLVNNQLMRQAPGGKFQTDFVILDGRGGSKASRIYESCFPQFSEELLTFLESHKELLTSDRFNRAGFTWERLLWVYLHFFTQTALGIFSMDVCKIVPYWDIPDRPNGGKWIALGFEGDLLFSQNASNASVDCMPIHMWSGPVHKPDYGFVQGFYHHWSGYDCAVFFEIPEGTFKLCADIVKGKPIGTLDEAEKYLLSVALEKSLFVKDVNEYKLNYFFVEQLEFCKLNELAKDFYTIAKKYFSKAWQIILDIYKDSVPKHLRWQMGNFLSNNLNAFVTCSIYESEKNGLLSTPSDADKAWLSLFAGEQ